ncbi:uncharacterized protein OCT59_018175 [Rhizophagus irregularis]|uniref:uncharacterized protein n=1 Tax=Rhizophagus irregularis TaxID=588596 RepID=UPI00331DB61F|nr:hypothetical protein OCT59_018175 [Rhizophagus irregularis]
MDYFFQKKIALTLVQQHRSIRGTFTSRIKDIMYSVFEATGHKLPSINTLASSSMIQEWKTYAISICETYLNPNNQNIQMSKSIMKSKIINNLQKLKNRDKFTHSDDDSHNGNDVDDGGDGAANDGAGAADDGATNNGKLNDGTTNNNDGAGDKGILSSDSYNTEEEGQYINSLLENYELHRK